MYVLEDELPESMLEKLPEGKSRAFAERIKRYEKEVTAKREAAMRAQRESYIRALYVRSLTNIPELLHTLSETLEALAEEFGHYAEGHELK